MSKKALKRPDATFELCIQFQSCPKSGFFGVLTEKIKNELRGTGGVVEYAMLYQHAKEINFK